MQVENHHHSLQSNHRRAPPADRGSIYKSPPPGSRGEPRSHGVHANWGIFKRRFWGASLRYPQSLDEKLRIVAETDAAGVRVSEVAARHGVYPGLLFTWRRQVRDGLLVAAPSATFAPVRLLAAENEAEPEVRRARMAN
jgi:transposase-like protein